LAGGVPTGFKALLWLNTPAGRRWTEIDTFTAGTVTVEDTFTIALASAVDCAVGGKRRTLAQTGFPSVDSAQLAADVKGGHSGSQLGWRVNLENTGGPYGQNVSLASSTTQGCVYQGIAGSSPPPATISMTIDATTLTPGNCDVQNLRFQNSAVAKTASVAIDITLSAKSLIYSNVIGAAGGLGHFRGIKSGGLGQDQMIVYANDIGFNTFGVDVNNGAFTEDSQTRWMWNYIHQNTTGARINSANCFSSFDTLWFRNLVVNNTGVGMTAEGPPVGGGGCDHPSRALIENTIDGNGSHGIDLKDSSRNVTLLNNQITNNGGFGIRCDAGTDGCETLNDKGIVAYNNFFGNASGARQNWPVGENESAVNPLYQDAVHFNWCLANLSQQGGPPGLGEVFPATNTSSFLVPGVCQPGAPGGGGAGCCLIK
jgi:parallel beta-helix repeat protein